MKQVTLYPGAKINIGLYVFEKRADGFHEIESIFYPVGPVNSNLVREVLTVTVFHDKEEFCSCLSDDGSMKDKACFCLSDDMQKVRMVELGLDYPGAPEDNICVKAYNLLDADFQLPPAMIVLEKHIPVGAGLGGGSSDGVCTLKALNELCNLKLSEAQLLEYAARLGSDCPFFVKNEPMLVTGRGEILTPLLSPPEAKDAAAASASGAEASRVENALKNLMEKYTVRIVFSPDCFVSTKKAYSIVPKRKKSKNLNITCTNKPTALDNNKPSAPNKTKPETAIDNNQTQAPYLPIIDLITEPVESWQGRIVNDFEAPVFNEFPQLRNVKDSLMKSGASYVSMTGSGSAIFGIFTGGQRRTEVISC